MLSMLRHENLVWGTHGIDLLLIFRRTEILSGLFFSKHINAVLLFYFTYYQAIVSAIIYDVLITFSAQYRQSLQILRTDNVRHIIGKIEPLFMYS